MPGAYAVGSAGVARRRRRLPTDTRRIGWVVYGLLDHVVPGFWALDPVIAMRVGRVARELNAPGTRLTNELYRPDERYDVVVFAKVMDERHRREAERARERGAIVVYDAHVNYYEVWGDYEIEGTAPTEAQQRDAVEMTRLADHVLTSSSYLLEQVRRFNPNASWIPDGVDPTLYRGTRRHEPGPLRLVWSGVAKKARQLDAVVDVLARLPHAELVVVSDGVPDILPELERVLPTRLTSFSDRRYARLLRGRDVIISPKRLANAYEMGHSEYKITLGMAIGLPAVASPQQSYLEALAGGGGFVVDSPEEWRDALERLADPALRAEIGARAQQTVRERYSTPVVAQQYAELFRTLT
jgi:glycosyltransferase involved in cell wall biosynthesis